MPRVTTVQTNFTAGELSPKLYGRVDIERYQNAAKTLENVIPSIYGGVRRRDGFKYAATAKHADKAARLLPFVVDSSTAYVLEVGDQYMRFFFNNAQVLSAPLTPYEITTPWTEAQLFELRYARRADTMFVFHEETPIYRVRHFSDTNWTADAAPFEVQPYDEVGHTFAVVVTLSALTVGTGRTATAASPTWLAADVGRTITYNGGTAIITGYTSTTIVTVQITVAFETVTLPVSVWHLNGSPQTTITPTASTPEGGTVTLNAGAAAWRSGDVGKYVKINSGLVLITTFTSDTAVDGIIETELSSTTGAPADSWSLNAAVWNATNGYPRCGTFFQQRLCVGGSPGFPQTVWGSATAGYLDYTSGLDDSDAFTYTLDSNEVNPLSHLVSEATLVALTYGGEFTIKGGVEKPITPTNVSVDDETPYGCNSIRPIRVGKEIIYCDRSGKTLLGMSYAASIDAYDSVDLTALADHVSGDGFVDAAYARKPDPIIWAPRADGQMPSLTISRAEQVIAWARQVTAGQVESVATIPKVGHDETWALVKRNIDGSDVRYIEYLDPDVLLDCAITGTSGPGAAVWSGLTHLEGETVQCVADGAYMGEFTVSGGQITLPRAAFEVVIGLGYTSTVDLLPPEIQTGTGSSSGEAMSTSEVKLRVHETSACYVNGKEVAFRQFGSDLLDQAPPVFSGIKTLGTLGWNNGDSPLTITQPLPMPFHLLAVIRKLTVNSGGSQ